MKGFSDPQYEECLISAFITIVAVSLLVFLLRYLGCVTERKKDDQPPLQVGNTDFVHKPQYLSKDKLAGMCLIVEYEQLVRKCDMLKGRVGELEAEVEKLQTEAKNYKETALQEERSCPSAPLDPTCGMWGYQSGFTAPVRVHTVPNPNQGEEDPATVSRLEHTPMSPSDLQSMLKELPSLQLNNPNLPFWEKVQECMVVGGLHAFDVFTMGKAKCPVHPDSQFWFAFTVKGKQYTFTRLSQGFHNSPTLFHRALADVLAKLPDMASCVVQYVDDLLISSPDRQTHMKDLEVILQHLADSGVKCNARKAQIAKEQVSYLGYLISKGYKRLTVDRTEAINACPRPTTVREVRKVLGLFNFCRTQIPNYSRIVQPLNNLLKGAGGPHEAIEWTLDCEQAFTTLKQRLSTAPGLGLPNPLMPFTLYTHVSEGHMAAVLTQKHGDKQRPVAYYSSKLDAVAQAMPPCLQAVEGASMALNQATPLIGSQDVNIVVPHAVLAILSGKKSSAVHVARWTRWEMSLLMPSVHLQRASSLNPATLMPTPDEGHPHHCCLEEEPMDVPLTEHMLLTDHGANLFAKTMNIPEIPGEKLITERTWERWSKKLEADSNPQEDKKESGTVGAVAIDNEGNVACATSTGGLSNKLVGRVGDSACIGSGGYADNHVGAVSTTGHGESMMKVVLARLVLYHMEQGMTLEKAADTALNYMKTRVGGLGGVIVVSNSGDWTARFSTKQMSWATVKDDWLQYGIYTGEMHTSSVAEALGSK
ncbi:isoaspartyl peptidase/L-asparaginase isoform X1 [Pelodiscus sinensis]|uniref:isoaspartyl peptidase/L-asparaginase isoform X1 n=1 Tax=Pelodiscus sinensis TaxID=13735 RepID=UPI003F6D04E0